MKGVMTPAQKETLQRFDTWIANRRWSESLTNTELAEHLVVDLWSIEKFYTKKCAVIEETIDRLIAMDEKEKQSGHTETKVSS